MITIHISLPECGKPRWLRPDSQQLVIVVCKNDASPRAKSAHHNLRNSQWVVQMLQQKTRMGQIKSLPFVASQGRRINLSLPQLHQIEFVGVPCLPQSFSKLARIALDAYDPSASHFARHQSRELRQTASKIDDLLGAVKVHLFQTGFVQQRIQKREAPLFNRRRAVNIIRLKPFDHEFPCRQSSQCSNYWPCPGFGSRCFSKQLLNQ